MGLNVSLVCKLEGGRNGGRRDGGRGSKRCKHGSFYFLFFIFFDIELGYCHVEKNSLDFIGNFLKKRGWSQGMNDRFEENDA